MRFGVELCRCCDLIMGTAKKREDGQVKLYKYGTSINTFR